MLASVKLIYSTQTQHLSLLKNVWGDAQSDVCKTPARNFIMIKKRPFLGITPDARAGGMGDVGAATEGDLNAQYWNPSKYIFNESPGAVSISYTPWMSKIVNDINLLYLSGYGKIGENYSISGSLRYFSMGEIQLTDAGGKPMGNTSPYEMSLDAAIALRLSSNWSAAVAVRYIRSDFGAGADDLLPGNAVGADIAALYRLPFQVASSYQQKGIWAMGLNISNIGSKISYDETHSLFIPTNMRLGTTFSYPFDDYNRIAISADVNKLLVPHTPHQRDDKYLIIEPNGTQSYDEERWGIDYNNYQEMSGIGGIFKSGWDWRDIAWSAGLEYSYNNQFFVRGGYYHESKLRGNRQFFDVGAGFRLYMFQLDAAYVIATSQTNPLDQTFRLTLSFDADGLKELTR